MIIGVVFTSFSHYHALPVKSDIQLMTIMADKHYYECKLFNDTDLLLQRARLRIIRKYKSIVEL